MWKTGLALVSLCLATAIALYTDEPLLFDVFPEGFRWATATAAFQIEGAWNEDGNALSYVWESGLHSMAFIFRPLWSEVVHWLRLPSPNMKLPLSNYFWNYLFVDKMKN